MRACFKHYGSLWNNYHCPFDKNFYSLGDRNNHHTPSWMWIQINPAFPTPLQTLIGISDKATKARQAAELSFPSLVCAHFYLPYRLRKPHSWLIGREDWNGIRER